MKKDPWSYHSVLPVEAQRILRLAGGSDSMPSDTRSATLNQRADMVNDAIATCRRNWPQHFNH